MLFATGHLKVDLPRELGVATNRWPNIKFVLADALSPHRKLLELSQLRWDEAIRNRPQHPAKDTLLLLVARGSSDPAITSSFEDVANQLVAAYDAARAVTCYSGMATPLIRDALDAAVQGPHRRIVVQPYFLFTGVLVKQLHKITADWARRHPNKEILSTDHLGVHPLLADVFKERARDALAL
jgi:sirohydrochlorin ferrochelatase